MTEVATDQLKQGGGLVSRLILSIFAGLRPVPLVSIQTMRLRGRSATAHADNTATMRQPAVSMLVLSVADKAELARQMQSKV
jgi:hypothetical protein